MAEELQRFFRRTAEKIVMRKDTPSPKVIRLVIRRVRFDLVRTTLIAFRGFRGKVLQVPEKISNLDMHMEQTAF